MRIGREWVPYPDRMTILARRGAALGLLTIGMLVRASAQSSFTDPDQFLADKDTFVAAIVKVAHVETRWIVLSDGDHVPLAISDCVMEELLAGADAWPAGSSRSVMQFDYTDVVMQAIAPPAIEQRRYLLWTAPSDSSGEVPLVAQWTAHPQGMLLVRGRPGQEFVHWDGRQYSLDAIRERLKTGRRLPLDQIVDPVRRLSIANLRLERGSPGDEPAFIQGLLQNVIDPEGQAKRVERAASMDRGPGLFGMGEGQAQPHALWYESLALLRDFGKDERRRPQVIAALTPLARTARRRIRLAAALALVDLGSDAGREALIDGFNSDLGEVSSDPPDDMTFPGRYPYDDSSITACAHALARLGDRRGLQHAKPEVRLAAAEAFGDKADADVRAAIEKLAKELDPQVEALAANGELTKARNPRDFTNRYPPTWVRAHAFLARLGDDGSLRRLIDAYLTDAGTYPDEHASLVPTMRLGTWSPGPSPGSAILGADRSPERVQERLKALVSSDAWSSRPLLELRAALTGKTEPPATEPVKPTAADIRKLLADRDRERRAEGLAAAGYHQHAEFFDRVVDVALHGSGVERSAALYALAFYRRAAPDDALRELLATGDPDVRLSAVELATRTAPARFAAETIAVVRSALRSERTTPAPPGDQDIDAATLPRLLARLARGPLPAPLLDALADRDPRMRRVVVQALALAGNPDAVRPLQRLTTDPDAATRNAVALALRIIGPSGG